LQVVGLKKALADAGRQLSAQSRTLQQQYRKSLALESSLKLLDSIALVAAAPESIDRALADKVSRSFTYRQTPPPHNLDAACLPNPFFVCLWLPHAVAVAC
jgi:hypothetical protein